MSPSSINISSFKSLVSAIKQANHFFLGEVQKQVNTSFTVRNWIIGYYLAEYEQKGKDRSVYGEQLFKKISEKLKKADIKGLSFTTLHLYKQLYFTYTQIINSIPPHLYPNRYQPLDNFIQTPSGQSAPKSIIQNPISLLLNRLSFSHFIELVKIDQPLKRIFYETETIQNNWSVRDLQRAMNSMLFERTGLSKNKKAVLEKHRKGSGLQPEDIFRSPYLLDFLGLKEKKEYVESDLEQAIIDHLQSFLLEMGRGFCFEARQKRITFDNTHYRVDLVFYHRILKCHILLDLKMEPFSHADASQMNVYLNYFRENEMCEGDNLPIGIILCADKNETLVKYATTGLAHHIFVSKYMTSLPSEQELKIIIQNEQARLTQTLSTPTPRSAL